MEDSIRKMYFDLNKKDRSTLRQMCIKRFNISDDQFFNRLGEVRGQFSFEEQFIIRNWFEKKDGKYCIAQTQETLGLCGLLQQGNLLVKVV